MNGPDDVLDFGLIADIPKSKDLFEQKAKFHWEYYSELAYLVVSTRSSWGSPLGS
jgi:hypothetical protein